MNRDAFLTELSSHLERLPVKERTGVMDYYREYTAEIERQGGDICEVIGTPDMVAANAVADIAMNDMGDPKSGVRDKVGGFGLAIISLFALPIGLPVAIALSAVGIALFIALFAIVMAVFVLSISIFIAGVVGIVAAVYLATANPASGMFFAGAGIFLLGFGWFMKSFVKLLWNGSFKLIRRLFSCISSKKNK